MKALTLASILFTAFLVIAAIACFLLAIWGGKDTSNQWVATGFIAVFLGIPVGGMTAFAIGEGYLK